MGYLEAVGCFFLAFGAPFSMFVITIAPDPLRVILFIAGAFFWLVSLLLSSLLWFAVVPLRETLEFALFFAVVFQEGFRFIYFYLLKKAESGLQKVSENGMHIEGVHSIQNAKHTIAYVCGLGFGVMSGAFSLVNILADASGPGTPGLPLEANARSNPGHGNYLFFITSSLVVLAIILLHIFWNIIFWNGCRFRQPVQIVLVIVSHIVVSYLSVLNKKQLYYVSIPLTYIITAAMGIWAYKVAGGSPQNIRRFATSFRVRRTKPSQSQTPTTPSSPSAPSVPSADQPSTSQVPRARTRQNVQQVVT